MAIIRALFLVILFGYGFAHTDTAESCTGMQAEATVEIHTACLRPVPPDHIPIVGDVPGKHGVYIATGGGRKGILVGPAVGKSIADILVNGATDLPTASLGLERFMID